MEANIVVDARNKSCPGPLLALTKAVMKASPGQIIMLLSTDPGAPQDIREWASHAGHKVLNVEKMGETYRIYLEVLG